MHNMVMVLALLSACSFGMRVVPADWDGSYEPDCSDSYAPVIGDGLAAGLALGVASIAADASIESGGNAAASGVAVAGMAVAVGFAISTAVGESRRRECKDARTAWRFGGAISTGISQRDEARRLELERELARRDAEATAPRGFFCSSSPEDATAGFCVRGKPECERTRGVTISALPTLTECTLTERAWRIGDLYFPTVEACVARAQRTGGGRCEQTE